MKRIFLIILLLPVLLSAQFNKSLTFVSKYQKATVLNGTTQAWTAPSSSNLDINGFDMMFVAIASTTSSSETIILSRMGPYNAYNKLWMFGFNTSKPFLRLQDGTAANAKVVQTTNTFADGKLHLIVATLQRGGNAVIYVDGVSEGTTSIAVQASTYDTALTVTVGSRALLNANWFSGQVGALQLVRFSTLPTNIADIISGIGKRWKLKRLPVQYDNGTIILDIDWSSGGTDKSGKNNNMTPVASPSIINLKVF
jgi:hypothetical protein